MEIEEVREIELETVSINEKTQIFLDGKEIKNVKEYKLECYANKPAELTLTAYVNVGQVCSESKSKGLFVRIPLQNIEIEDSYEQSKIEKMKSINPEKVINYLDNILKDMVITISSN